MEQFPDMNFDQRLEDQLLQLEKDSSDSSLRDARVRRHLRAQRAANPCSGVPARRLCPLCLLSENTQIRLNKDSVLASKCVHVCV